MTVPVKYTYIVVYRDINGFFIYTGDIVAACLDEALHYARHKLDIQSSSVVAVYQNGVRVYSERKS